MPCVCAILLLVSLRAAEDRAQLLPKAAAGASPQLHQLWAWFVNLFAALTGMHAACHLHHLLAHCDTDRPVRCGNSDGTHTVGL